jgi:hypothetical protein
LELGARLVDLDEILGLFYAAVTTVVPGLRERGFLRITISTTLPELGTTSLLPLAFAISRLNAALPP